MSNLISKPDFPFFFFELELFYCSNRREPCALYVIQTAYVTLACGHEMFLMN